MLIDKIKKLAKLKHNWNSYGAVPIEPLLIDEAIAFAKNNPSLHELCAFNLVAVVPTNKGGLQIEIDTNDKFLELEFIKPGYITYLKGSKSTQPEEDTVATDSDKINELFGWIALCEPD